MENAAIRCRGAQIARDVSLVELDCRKVNGVDLELVELSQSLG